MTSVQLDEIEKRWAGYLEKDEVERRFLFDRWWDKRDFWDMTKALREAQAEVERLKSGRDYDAKVIPDLVRELEEAKLLLSVKMGTVEAQRQLLADNGVLLREAQNARDEARAEVAELREHLDELQKASRPADPACTTCGRTDAAECPLLLCRQQAARRAKPARGTCGWCGNPENSTDCQRSHP